MGMAASQARYLSLCARKTNTEYEGQQLNQQRLNLANQSADLFNQMLTMAVPTCPDSNDFTTLQYSWSDGINDEVISDYYQIGTPNEDYNYVVTSYHYEDVYTGAVKKMTQPQIQASKTNHFTVNPDKAYTVNQITYHGESVTGAGDDSYTIDVERNGVKSTRVFKRADTLHDRDTLEALDAIYGRTAKLSGTDATFTAANGANPAKWTIAGTAGDNKHDVTIKNPAYDPTQPEDPTTNPKTITVDLSGVDFTQLDLTDENNKQIVDQLATSYGETFDPSKNYFYYQDATSGAYIFLDGADLELAKDSQGAIANIQVRGADTTVYYTDGTNFLTAEEIAQINLGATPPVNTLNFHSASNDPTYDNFTAVGNCDLTALTVDNYNENSDISTELQQILKDMKTSNPEAYANLAKCFDETTGEYLGGIYSFKMYGTTYYTTSADLESAVKGAYDDEAIANNGIDSQYKLAYYKASYISTKVEESKRALLETDGKGRFKTVKFEDDSVVYTLNCETITDEAAYDNAMNQYYYNQEKYDKAVADINARTEIIQAEDRELELRLEQLNTEQSALQTEMEACKKVVSKNIENGFKAFGG